MFEMMRRVFGPVAISIIIGAIAMVFVFYGVFNPRASQYGGAASAAVVNGENISTQEFYREYQQRLDLYQQLMKGKADSNFLKQLGLKQQVIDSMVQRKLMLQEAKKLGLFVSDEQLREKIQSLPYFQKNGKFDHELYKNLLQANRYSPAVFEDTIREDALREQLQILFAESIKVSDQELRNELALKQEKRELNLVFLPAGQDAKAKEDFLKKAKVASASRTRFKQFESELKKKKLEVRSTGQFDRLASNVGGVPVADLPDLLKDAFKENSPLEKAKIYEFRGQSILAFNLKNSKPKATDFEKQKETLEKTLLSQKQNQVFEKWMTDVKAKSKIAINKQVVQSDDF